MIFDVEFSCTLHSDWSISFARKIPGRELEGS